MRQLIKTILLLFFIFSLTGSQIYSQPITKIMGKIIDADTKEPLPFVTVAYIGGKFGSTIGVTTTFEGQYSLDTKLATDSITASFVGYIPQTKKVDKGKFQTIDFELKKNTFNLHVVEIVPTFNPAEVILKKIIAKKDINNREKFDAYQYEAYTKVEFDANNISEKFQNRRVFKPFQFVFDNMDTSTVNGKSYLPLFLTETLSDIFYRKKPKTQKEFLKGSRVSGIDNESVAKYMKDMYQDINVYDNYITLFQKNFISPIANFGLAFYKYYLIDSTFIGNKWCYNIMFKPRRKQELTFTGNFWVNDTTWAMKRVDMRIVDDANLNFINDLIAQQEFNQIDSSNWMVTNDLLVLDFNPIENTKSTMGFYGKKTSSYTKFVLNKPREDDFYNTPNTIVVEDGAFYRDEVFWSKARHDSLEKNEKAIYQMVDSVKSLPAFKTYVDIIKTVIMGYKIWGNFEIGPYMSMYSFNTLEGNRFRFGGRTSNKFSKKLMLEAHVAYGTKDEEWKYGGGFLYMMSKNPRKSFGASYKYDIEQLGESQHSFRNDYLLGALLRRSPADKLTMVNEYKAFYQHEWFTGFSNQLNFTHREIFPLSSTIIGNSNGYANSPVISTEFQLVTRFAYKEKFVMGEFERVSMGTTYPIIELKYSYGVPNLWNSNYEYHNLNFSITHWFNVGGLGWSKYLIETGRIFGHLPYQLLKLHEGNETFFFDEYSFNLMNYYEFYSDKYFSVLYSHHFEGFFLNHIPLMRKLKWREVGYVKALFGDIDKANKIIPNSNTELYSLHPMQLSKPYVEASIGIENILKILRVDFMWRLTHQDHHHLVGTTSKNITRYGLMISLFLDF